MAINVIVVSLVGGVLALDRIVVQAMLTRPIVAAPIAGLVLGDVYTGLQAGALLELFWINELPVGTYVPPNDFMVAFLVAAASILAGQTLGTIPPRELIAGAVLLFLPCGFAGRLADNLIIKSNDGLYTRALQAAEHVDLGGIFRAHLTGVVKQFLVYSGLFFVFLFLGAPLLAYLFAHLPSFMVRALNLTYFALPLLGLAAGLGTVNLKATIPLFCALFLTLSVVVEWAQVLLK